ncbi:hypothetical protein GCM10027275_52620 [Rhabdobacter roseus]|uniref:S1-C subfamily serine protease n=1 Tax=Rhabdobacter roseus TaxID=1655419 RepID=A0A840U0Q6_9BACT|nr:trypsin-like peptidase domain-containing protein [Rhabdobacter roseus]MBB5287337.1 S1-C subfamily serine protease [Rhabdobacter roseus]
MAASIQKFVIRHLSGTKANQTEEFDFNKFEELTFGRSADNHVRFDPELDLMVSREHGRIVKANTPASSFTIEDNESRNGLFVNGKRVQGASTLMPGDEVQLGNNGPTFVFDVDPRPQDLMPATRMVSLSKPTTEANVPEVVAVEPKAGIGKDTFERVITHERSKSRTTLWTAMAAAVVIFGAIGFTMWKNQPNAEDIKKEVASTINESNSKLLNEIKGLQDNLGEIKQKAENSPLSETEIAALNLDKVVKIETSWGLFDPATGEALWQLYQEEKMPDGSKAIRGVFMQTPDGKIEPYLITSKNAQLGIPIGAAGGWGTGFVVSENGLIMTNRHVAYSWQTSYSFPQEAFPGIVVGAGADGKMAKLGYVDQGQVQWVPSEARYVNGYPSQVEGRTYSMKVVFAGSTNRRDAVVNIASQNHDVALIKIDVAKPLAPVELLDNYDSIKQGDQAVVMGYPGASPEQFLVRKSNDPFKPNSATTSMANPTMTSGNVAKLIKSSTEFAPTMSQMGDAYQLTINATGPGNSGGPMFDNRGRVIGIYFAQQLGAGPHITYAVPIKYGLEILNNK